MFYVISDLTRENLENSFSYFYDMIMETKQSELLLQPSKGFKVFKDVSGDWFVFIPSTNISDIIDQLNNESGKTAFIREVATVENIIIISLRSFNEIALLFEDELNKNNQLDLLTIKHMIKNASIGG